MFKNNDEYYLPKPIKNAANKILHSRHVAKVQYKKVSFLSYLSCKKLPDLFYNKYRDIILEDSGINSILYIKALFFKFS